MRETSANGNLGYLFRLGYQAFRDQLEDALSSHGLTVPDYGALSAFEHTRELSSADLSRLIAVTPQTMNTLVHSLVRRELLARRPDPQHGRIVLLRLTPSGRAVLRRATPAVRRVEHDSLAGLTRSEVAVLKRWLSGLADQA